MKVNDLMTRGRQMLHHYRRAEMWEYDIGCVPVVDKYGRVTGMLTDHDICVSAYIQGASLTGALATSAMSKQVLSCAADDDIAVAENLMKKTAFTGCRSSTPSGIRSDSFRSTTSRVKAPEAETKKPRQVTDTEIAQMLASVCAPRHRIIEAQAA